MRKVRELITNIQELVDKKDTAALRKVLFEFLLYSPKFPLRNQQQLLLEQSQQMELEVFDKYFAQQYIKIKTFSWGQGRKTVLLTHGWASKAGDFYYMIQRFLDQGYRIIAFDAPGNGSSEGRLTNLLLYVESIREVIAHYGRPHVMIGHSLGATANMIALNNLPFKPALLVSLTPLINLENYFTSQLMTIGVDKLLIDQFYADFFDFFRVEASYFNLCSLYRQLLENHWLFYDEYDKISPYCFVEDFLNAKNTIRAKAFNGVGHESMLKNEDVLSEILLLTASAFH